MSKSNRYQRLPVEVDPFRLVEQHRVLDGRIPLGDFSRLAELLAQPKKAANTSEAEEEAKEAAKKDVVLVHLEFKRSDTGLAEVVGHISADLDMQCQRCLQVKTEAFSTEFEVVLVTSDEQEERMQQRMKQGFDTWFVEDQKIFLLDFIEDEILLALPLAVMHDNCKAVRELIEAKVDAVDEAKNTQVEQKENPFAVLKDLKLK